jgi:helicase
MDINALPLSEPFKKQYGKFNILTPIQEKAVKAGLLEGTSLLACAPTASGKTLIATMSIYNTLDKGKAIYLVPLKALGTEKYKEYRNIFKDSPHQVGLATGDVDSESDYLAKYDVLILTTEKLDSLLRHKVSWLSDVKVVIVDEIHLLNDSSRGPTLEIILTLLKNLIKPQIIGLSATIGNPKELAEWLGATLVIDDWRPVELNKGIYVEGQVEYY